MDCATCREPENTRENSCGRLFAVGERMEEETCMLDCKTYQPNSCEEASNESETTYSDNGEEESEDNFSGIECEEKTEDMYSENRDEADCDEETSSANETCTEICNDFQNECKQDTNDKEYVNLVSASETPENLNYSNIQGENSQNGHDTCKQSLLCENKEVSLNPVIELADSANSVEGDYSVYLINDEHYSLTCETDTDNLPKIVSSMTLQHSEFSDNPKCSLEKEVGSGVLEQNTHPDIVSSSYDAPNTREELLYLKLEDECKSKIIQDDEEGNQNSLSAVDCQQWTLQDSQKKSEQQQNLANIDPCRQESNEDEDLQEQVKNYYLVFVRGEFSGGIQSEIDSVSQIDVELNSEDQQEDRNDSNLVVKENEFCCSSYQQAFDLSENQVDLNEAHCAEQQVCTHGHVSAICINENSHKDGHNEDINCVTDMVADNNMCNPEHSEHITDKRVCFEEVTSCHSDTVELRIQEGAFPKNNICFPDSENSEYAKESKENMGLNEHSRVTLSPHGSSNITSFPERKIILISAEKSTNYINVSTTNRTSAMVSSEFDQQKYLNETFPESYDVNKNVYEVELSSAMHDTHSCSSSVPTSLKNYGQKKNSNCTVEKNCLKVNSALLSDETFIKSESFPVISHNREEDEQKLPNYATSLCHTSHVTLKHLIDCEPESKMTREQENFKGCTNSEMFSPVSKHHSNDKHLSLTTTSGLESCNTEITNKNVVQTNDNGVVENMCENGKIISSVTNSGANILDNAFTEETELEQHLCVPEHKNPETNTSIEKNVSLNGLEWCPSAEKVLQESSPPEQAVIGGGMVQKELSQASRTNKRKYEETVTNEAIEEKSTPKVFKLEVNKSFFHPEHEHHYWCIWRMKQCSPGSQDPNAGKKGWECALESIQECLNKQEEENKWSEYARYLHCLDIIWELSK